MDITWSGSITIDRPIAQVYAYLADLPRHAEWAQSVQQLIEAKPGAPDGVGRVYRTIERQGWQTDRRPHAPISRGVPGDTMCEIVALQPNRRIAWRSWAPVPGVRHEGEYAFDLAPTPGGGTHLTQSASLHDNWLGDLVSRIVFGTTPERAYAQWQASLQNIKVILEDRAGAEAPARMIAQGGAYVR
jgi:uncharacterized membrane protein